MTGPAKLIRLVEADAMVEFVEHQDGRRSITRSSALGYDRVAVQRWVDARDTPRGPWVEPGTLSAEDRAAAAKAG